MASDIIGVARSYELREGDTLLDVALDRDLGYVELLLANPGVDPWVPKAGLEILLPHETILPAAERAGVVINLTELRLYYFPPDGRAALTFPIGIGRMGHETPLGQSRIVKKRLNPTWIPTKSIRAEDPELPERVPPGPDNPLGDHALNLDWPGYVIHGTNRPYGVGRRVSHGCIRMYPEDIAALFALVALGTPVTIVDQPIKTGWRDGDLYLEVHPTAILADALASTGRLTPFNPPDPSAVVLEAVKGRQVNLDWSLIRKTAQERRGVPVRISLPNTN